MAQAVTQIRVAFAGRDPRNAWHDRVVAAAGAVNGVAVLDALDDADVIVALDASDGGSKRTPPFGVWRFGFGSGAAVANGAVGTLARLYRESGDPARAVVLHEGWYRGRTAEGWGTPSVPLRVAPWVARALTQVLLGDRRIVEAPLQSTAGCRDLNPPPIPDSIGIRAANAARDLLTRQRWTVGIVTMPLEALLQRESMPEPSWLTNQPGDRFYADPFVVAADRERIELLVEQYRYRSREKTIVGLDVSECGVILRSESQHGIPPHASYPFLLRDGAEMFCIPETFRARRAAAMRRSANNEWTHACDLVSDFPAVDSTIVSRHGRWWLFCTKQGDEDQTELHLFHAADWRGPWQPHPLNPVKSDTRSSRPAGACFELDRALYRPAQNCARRYGAGITINRVVDLTTTSFREEAVWSYVPRPDSAWPDGMHTINSCGAITVVDGLRIERRLGPAHWSGGH